ncbi:MAG: hypothetical protein GY711_06815 [bacterium]|nr:hypothetical protein [bacterium]
MLQTLQDAPELEPWLRLILGCTVGVAALWLAVLVFVSWRRSLMNLTPVTAAPVNPNAQPRFLIRDREARALALERADAFAQELQIQKERAERTEQHDSSVTRFAGFASLFMATFSLAAMIAGAVWQVTWIGTVWERYSASERLVSVMKSHPLAFSVCVLVITYHVVSFFVERKWRAES